MQDIQSVTGNYCVENWDDVPTRTDIRLPMRLEAERSREAYDGWDEPTQVVVYAFTAEPDGTSDFFGYMESA